MSFIDNGHYVTRIETFSFHFALYVLAASWLATQETAACSFGKWRAPHDAHTFRAFFWLSTQNREKPASMWTKPLQCHTAGPELM